MQANAQLNEIMGNNNGRDEVNIEYVSDEDEEHVEMVKLLLLLLLHMFPRH